MLVVEPLLAFAGLIALLGIVAHGLTALRSPAIRTLLTPIRGCASLPLDPGVYRK